MLDFVCAKCYIYLRMNEETKHNTKEQKMKLNQVNSEAARKMQEMNIENLVLSFELTELGKGQEIPMVRGWLMDELETRNPEAFEKWLDSCEDSPRKFYIQQ